MIPTINSILLKTLIFQRGNTIIKEIIFLTLTVIVALIVYLFYYFRNYYFELPIDNNYILALEIWGILLLISYPLRFLIYILIKKTNWYNKINIIREIEENRIKKMIEENKIKKEIEENRIKRVIEDERIKQEKVNIIDVSSKTTENESNNNIQMKPNLYQRIILVFFLITIMLSCIILVPYGRYYGGIEYKPIWVGGYINLYRLAIELFVIIVTFGVLFLIYSKKNNPDFNDSKTKKIIRNELLLFLIIIGFSLLYFLVSFSIRYYTNGNKALPIDKYIVFICIIVFYPLRIIVNYIRKLIKYLNS